MMRERLVFYHPHNVTFSRQIWQSGKQCYSHAPNAGDSGNRQAEDGICVEEWTLRPYKTPAFLLKNPNKTFMNNITRNILAASILATGLLGLSGQMQAAGQAKNVILMISDGQGFNTIKATDYFYNSQGVYESFDVKGSMNTSSAGKTGSGAYTGAAYDPASMWSDFNYQKIGATDSASAATAMYTGTKNYDNQVNVSTTGQTLTTFFEKMGDSGKATGAVSTVNFDHATPAAVVGHTTNRNDYTTITSQMINSNLDVIMGAGNPFYNNNGQAVTPAYSIVGTEANWTAITSETNGRKFIETQSDFQALANGTLTADKVFGVAQVKDTLQDSRTGTALNTNVPTLKDMTLGALNVLDNNPNGFAVMIEGGAIDWANHANALSRSIYEQNDFNASVKAVTDYLDANTNGNNWSNTLLIVTADHECGGLWGGSTLGQFAQVVDNGEGVLPGAVYNSGGHTNALVPFFAKGAGSDLFAKYLTGTDSQLASQYGVDADFNKFIDNTNIYNVMTEAVPEPSTYLFIASGLATLVCFRHRRRFGK